MYCEFCGKAIPDKALACPECGYPVKEANLKSQPPVEPNQQETTMLDPTQIRPQAQPQYQVPERPSEPVYQPQPQFQTTETQPEPAYQSQPQYQPPEAPSESMYQPQSQPQYQSPAVQYQPQYQPAGSYQYQPNAQQPTPPKQPKEKKKHPALISGFCSGFGVALIAVGAFLILWLTGFVSIGENPAAAPASAAANTPQQVAEELANAISNTDGQAMVDLIPDAMIDDLAAESGAADEEELAASLEEVFSASMVYIYSMGGTVDFTVEDTGAPVSGSELEEIQELYTDYGQVTAAETVPVTMTIDIMGETATDNEEVPVIQMDGVWYLDILQWNA